MTSPTPQTLHRTVRLAAGCGLLTLVTGITLLVLLGTANPSSALFLLFFVAKISFAAGIFSLASVDFTLRRNTRFDGPAIRSKMRLALIILLLNIPLGLAVITSALRPGAEAPVPTEQQP